jgi:dienelactone hydrolase
MRRVWNPIIAMLLAALGAGNSYAVESTQVTFQNAPYNGQPFTSVKARLTIPAGESVGEKLFPVVIVLQACGGLDDNVTTDWPNFLGQRGFATLVPDLLGSRDLVSACDREPIPLDERMRDVYGAIAFLANHPRVDHDRIHVLGFSWGGTHVLEALLERRLGQFATPESARVKNGVAVYPGCIGIFKAVTERHVSPAFYAPALIIGAELDDWTPVSQCRVVVEGQRTPPKVQMEIMAGAHHGFDQWTSRGRRLSTRQVLGYTMAPSQAATDAARRLTVEFLEAAR